MRVEEEEEEEEEDEEEEGGGIGSSTGPTMSTRGTIKHHVSLK